MLCMFYYFNIFLCYVHSFFIFRGFKNIKHFKNINNLNIKKLYFGHIVFISIQTDLSNTDDENQ